MMIELLGATMGARAQAGDLIEARAMLEESTAALGAPRGATCTPGRIDGVEVEWVEATSASRSRVILYFHGGGYTAGSVNTHRTFVARLSEGTGAAVCNVGYRLAPEHPHPAALDDALAVYRWLCSSEGGTQPEHLAVVGDSAGGGLSVALLVALRDGGDPLPATAALLSPWTDLAMTGESHDTRAHLDPMCSRASLQPSADAYLAGADPRTPSASPLYADLSGLPPLLVHVGDHEVLRDDAVELAANAEAAGTKVDLWVAPEMIHVWHLFAGMVPESDAALGVLCRWLTDHLG